MEKPTTISVNNVNKKIFFRMFFHFSKVPLFLILLLYYTALMAANKFDTTTNTLTLPSVLVDNSSSYDVEMVYQGSNLFKLTSISKPRSNMSVDELDFSLRPDCVYYKFETNGTSFFHTSGNQAERYIDLYLVVDNGDVILDFYDEYEIKLIYNELYQPTELMNHIIQENIAENLLMKCTYAEDVIQEFHLFTPLKLRKEWLMKENLISGHIGKYGVKDLNDQLFVISILSDLYFKIYKKAYKHVRDQNSAIHLAEEFMEANFPGSVYGESKNSDYHIATGREPETLQGGYYKIMKDLSHEYTNLRADILNDLVAQQYEFITFLNKSCTHFPICTMFIKSFGEELTRNSGFEDGLNYWEKEQIDNASSTGEISSVIISVEPSKQHAVLSLQSDNHGDTRAQKELYQEIIVNNFNDFEHLLLEIVSMKTTGGSTSFGGFSLWSGLSAYFICFLDEEDVQLGCAIFGNWTDNIELPILIGEQFKVQSSNDMYFSKISSGYNWFVVDVISLINNNLAKVRQNKHSIKKILIGATVAELFGSQENTCDSCFAELEASKIRLIK